MGTKMNLDQIKKNAPDDAKFYHANSKKYVKNIRFNDHDCDIADGYIYAYDFFENKKWHGCVCKPKTLFNLVNLKPRF